MRALASCLAVMVVVLALGNCAHAQPSGKRPGPAGAWEMTATDAAMTTWTGQLALEAGEGGELTGHIDWSGSDGSAGREYVTVKYDRSTRAISLSGDRLEDASGIAIGQYFAVFADDGAHLVEGKWKSDGAAGAWSAVRQAEGAIGKAPVGNAMATGFVHQTYAKPDGGKARFVVFVPHTYDGTTAVPVILFLHGSGETKGAGGDQPVEVGLGPYIKAHERAFPFLTIFPQAEEEGWARNKQLALGILDQTLATYTTDPKRVYLTGLSMGGSGTWNFAASEPQRWAAIAPICGAANPAKAEALKDIPCWAFHGSADQIIPVTKSRQMVAAIKLAGGAPRYTEFPKVGHASWDRAYETRGFWTWLAEQKRE